MSSINFTMNLKLITCPFQFLALLCSLAFSQELPSPLVDDFDDGDIDGWTHESDARHSNSENVDGALEITGVAGASGRFAANTFESRTFDDFVVEVDVLPDESGKIASQPGLFARIPRFGSGYGMNIQQSPPILEIWRFTNGSGAQLKEQSLDIPFERPLRLVFKGVGNVLTAQVLDEGRLIGEISVSDTAYDSGWTGVVSWFPGGQIARFDNFTAYHPGNPPSLHPSPSPGSRIAINPVIDGLTFAFKYRFGRMEVHWSGGGSLQQLDEGTRAIDTVATVSPFLTESSHGIFRIADIWMGNRTTDIYVPSSYRDETAAPLVIALSSEALEVEELAESNRFLLAQPMALADGTVTDAGYLRGVIEAAQNRWNIDANRLFLYAAGDAAAIAYQLADEYSDVIAGMAIVGANGENPSIIYAEPIHVLEIAAMPIRDLSGWAAVAGHERSLNESEPIGDGQQVIATRWLGGDTHTEVVSWQIDDIAAIDPTLRDVAINWLLARPKAEKQPFYSHGTILASTAEDCPDIATLVTGRPLAQGAHVRAFFKEADSPTNAFGKVSGQYALDLTMIEVQGLEDPVPVRAVGSMFITTEAGDKTYWEMESNLDLTTGLSHYRAALLRGDGAQEGTALRVDGIAIGIENGFTYESRGWWRPGT